MRKHIILIATLLTLGAGLSMNADAKDWRHHGKQGHRAEVHHHHHYRSHRHGHRHRGHRRHHRDHYYRSYRPTYYSGYRTRYYVPHRRVYVYGPPPPGVTFEYYRPSSGIWISVGF